MARVGIIGTGWGARVQAPMFKRAGLEVGAIAGRDPVRTKAVASELGVRAADDWRAIVADGSIDLVSIVTPPVHHREMTLAALEAGRHVLCEKPTAMDADEAEDMMRAAESHESQLALIDHELRFLPAWRHARATLGEIGHVRYIDFRYASPVGGNPDRPWTWWSDARQGGGIWGAVGSHAVDAIRYLVGEIEEVQAVEQTFVAERKMPDGGSRVVTSDDFAAVHLRLANGAIGAMSFSIVNAVDEPTTLTIHGENGGMRLVAGEIWRAERAGMWEKIEVDSDTPDEKGPGDSPGGYFGNGSYHLGRALVSALDDGDKNALVPAATFFDGWKQQRVLDAARASAAGNGSWHRV